MSDHDGHTINVGPVTIGEPLARPPVAAFEDEQVRRLAAEREVSTLRAENARLRDLLRRALPWIDPNDRHEDYLLTVAIREALGEPT